MGIAQSLAAEVFSYDPETGILTNRVDRPRPGGKAGTEAGFDNKNGYRRVIVAGKKYYTHQIIWLLMTGEWPDDEIDHKDGNGMNNRWSNLRQADRFENTQNTKKRAHSKQPYKGVRTNRSGNWEARIVCNKKYIHLGVFPSAEDARDAYVAAGIRLHGEFARAE